MVLGVVTSLALLAVTPVLVGMTSTVVMSDSMSPGIMAGDVVVVRPTPAADVRIGQVVLVDDPSFPGRLRLHRLAAREEGRYVLKGDANAQRDPTPVSAAAVHGVGFLRVPWIGLPLLWLRTGDALLALLAAGGIGGLALAVVLLDDAGGGAAVRVVRLTARIAFRGRRARLAWLGLVGVLVAGPTVHAQLDLGPSARAGFSSTSTSPADSLTAATTFASSSCWALPSAPSIAYSFSTAANASTPAAEPNVGSLGAGSGSAYTATLSSASLRVPGTCASGSGPSLRFTGSGSESVVSRGTIAAANTGTQSIWFSPAAASGVLLDLGSAAGNSAAAVDRQLYFTTDGKLAFAMRNGSAAPVTCSIPTAVTLNTWHEAAVTYNSSTLTFVLFYDGSSTSCTGTLTTAPTLTTSYTRIGTDVALASDASTAAYAGGVDEVYEWGTVLTPAQIDAVKAGGH